MGEIVLLGFWLLALIIIGGIYDLVEYLVFRREK